VKLTSAALQAVHNFAVAVRSEDGTKCQIMAITWTREGWWKGPEDTEWKTTGPGLSLGAYRCGQLPSDVIETIDGMPMVISGETASQFDGKIIDWENGKFVLKDR
jgi:hypothetical protein